MRSGAEMRILIACIPGPSSCGTSTGRSLRDPPPRRQGGVASMGKLRHREAQFRAHVAHDRALADGEGGPDPFGRHPLPLLQSDPVDQMARRSARRTGSKAARPPPPEKIVARRVALAGIWPRECLTQFFHCLPLRSGPERLLPSPSESSIKQRKIKCDCTTFMLKVRSIIPAAPRANLRIALRTRRSGCFFGSCSTAEALCEI